MKLKITIAVILFILPAVAQTGNSLKIFSFKDNSTELSFQYPENFSFLRGGGIAGLVWDEGGSNATDPVHLPPEKAIYIDVILSSDDFGKTALDQYFILSDSIWYDRNIYEKGIRNTLSENIQLENWNGIKVYSEWDLSKVFNKEFVQKGFRYLISKNFGSKNIYICADQRNAPDIKKVLSTICETISFKEISNINDENKIYKSIRDVDFFNFTYSEDGSEGFYVKDGSFTAEIDDGKSLFILTTYEIVSISFGDLTGDGKEEAAISSIENTNLSTGRFSGGYVYTIKEGKPEMMYKIAMGDRAWGGIYKLEIKDGLYYESRYDGLLGSSDYEYIIKIGYKWNGKEFIKKTCEEYINGESPSEFKFNYKDTLYSKELRNGITIYDKPKYWDYFLLELEKKQNLQIEVISDNPKEDMYLVLTDSKGKVLNNCQDIRVDKINLIVLSDGFYTLRVTPEGGWSSNYKLTVKSK
jgi:hypothetical protein